MVFLNKIVVLLGRSVIPAKAGIPYILLDPRLRGDDWLLEHLDLWDGNEIVTRQFLIPRRKSPKMLHAIEENLDEMAFFVEQLVILRRTQHEGAHHAPDES